MKPSSLSHSVSEKIIETFIHLSAAVSIVGLVLIFIFIGKESLPVFTSPEIRREASLSKIFLPQSPEPGEEKVFRWQPVSVVPKYSLLPLVVGTLKATAVALLFAIPLALAAALFTSEFAPSWLREWVKPVIELLAGIPSVVMGFFALIVMATYVQELFGLDFRLNAISAGIALGLAVVPVVYTMAEDALSAVPQSYREGSIALGATPWQTAWRVVLPAAFPGIFAACILGLGRAIGETMIVLMASGNAAVSSWSPTDPFRSLSATIAAEMGEVVRGSTHYHVLFFIGVLLFLFTFFINYLGQLFVERLRQKLSGTDK
ncbi:MAG TPA: phosphate ABC transporter permease subunit PstC [Elusimicrobiota bacterium]|nr:phosphate ABC transporter permease subunit PstC [Elusimicrobiota bacterium]